MLQALPLSWNYNTVTPPSFETLLLRSGRTFVYSACFNTCAIQSMYAALLEIFPKGFIFRGAEDTLLQSSLVTPKYFVASSSADIHLATFKPKPSVQALIRRGAKRNIITSCNQDEAKKFFAPTTYNSTRRKSIRYLYQENFSDHLQYFCARCKEHGDPKVLLSISQAGESFFHLETMRRSPSSQAGDVESCIAFAITQMQKTGAQFFSLGEAILPSAQSYDRPLRLFSTMLPTVLRSPLCTSARSGLYHFKNKFEPQWIPRYWIGYPRLSPLDLIEIASRSHFLQLPFPH